MAVRPEAFSFGPDEPDRSCFRAGDCHWLDDMRIFMPAHEHESVRALGDAQTQQFIREGFVRIDRAFPRSLAAEGREIMWRHLPGDPDDPTTWTKPVIR